jgi:hypothetical protein
MMVYQNTGLMLTLLVALMGTVMYPVNSIVQAGAMELAEGQNLEGSSIGLLWGNNAIFGSFSPLNLGVLATVYGFGIIFPLRGVPIPIRLVRLACSARVARDAENTY